ncbi:MAG TPA: glycosyltransferase family 2 protein [Candidatus Sulfotelmatobacter sp.]|nr:glycosyltransferase family 2 protein [Candidatus Sulfotelmatobacter sp.]
MSDTLPISVLLLARDEGPALEALLPRLAFAREVVVVWDANGDAATRAIAERLGARVHSRALDGFGAQRRFALEHCREPWVLWIDADELPAQPPGPLLAPLIASPDLAGATITRRGFFLGRRIRYCGWQSERLVRLFRRDRARFDDAAVHEQVHVEGRIARSELAFDHHSYRSWDACVDKLRRYAGAGAAKAWQEGRRAGALDVALRPPLRFARQYLLQLGFLDGGYGAVLCALAAAQVALKYAELWARTRGVPVR